MKSTRTVYHRQDGARELPLVDATQAVARHPNEWSDKPWTDATARAAADVDDAARKRDADVRQAGRDRVDPGVAHAEPVVDQPRKPATAEELGNAAPAIAPQPGVSAIDEGVQAAVPNSDAGDNRPVGPGIDATMPDTNVPLKPVDIGPRANPQNDDPKPIDDAPGGKKGKR